MMLVSVLIISFILGLDHTYLPPANEFWGKVMFSWVFVCPRGRGLSTGWGLPRGSASGGWGSASGGWGSASRGEESASKGSWAEPPGTGKAGCTHPTGMLFVWVMNLKQVNVKLEHYLTKKVGCHFHRLTCGHWKQSFLRVKPR